MRRCPVRLLVEGSFFTRFFFKQARSLAFLRRFSRSRLCRARNCPCIVPYCLPVLVVTKFAMPTSMPTTGASRAVTILISSSKVKVSHQHPPRLLSVTLLLIVRRLFVLGSVRACL